MDEDTDWRADPDRWLEPFLAGLNHAARRAMCPHMIAGLIGLGERKSMALVAFAFLHHRRLAAAERGKKVRLPPPQPTLPTVRRAMVEGMSRPMIRCTHCDRLLHHASSS